MRRRLLARALTIGASLLGVAALPGGDAPVAAAACARSRPAVAYHPGGADLPARDGPRLVPCRFDTHAISMEPSFGFGRGGDIFFENWGTSQNLPGGVPPVSGVLRSTDGGRSWRDVSPRVAGARTHPFSFDPQLIVDPR